MIRPMEVFNIEKNKIICKIPCSISIDDRDYDKRTFFELTNKFEIPGLLQFYIPSLNDFTQIALNYSVDLLKTNNIDEGPHVTTIHYDVGDVVITKDYVATGTDIGLLERLLQGNVKYVNDPKVLINLLHDILSDVDLIHLELIISNMFRLKDNEDVRCRFSGNYSNSVILGVKQQPYQDSWKSAFAFQFAEKAISIGLVNGKPSELNPIEKVLNEDFDNL